MPFMDFSFEKVILKWMINLNYFINKPLSREDELEKSQHWAS